LETRLDLERLFGGLDAGPEATKRSKHAYPVNQTIASASACVTVASEMPCCVGLAESWFDDRI
jgi:hypothetical protein